MADNREQAEREARARNAKRRQDQGRVARLNQDINRGEQIARKQTLDKSRAAKKGHQTRRGKK